MEKAQLVVRIFETWLLFAYSEAVQMPLSTLNRVRISPASFGN